MRAIPGVYHNGIIKCITLPEITSNKPIAVLIVFPGQDQFADSGDPCLPEPDRTEESQ